MPHLEVVLTTQGDQVRRVQLSLGMQVEGLDVVDVESLGRSTGRTLGIGRDELTPHRRPLGTSRIAPDRWMIDRLSQLLLGLLGNSFIVEKGTDKSTKDAQDRKQEKLLHTYTHILISHASTTRFQYNNYNAISIS